MKSNGLLGEKLPFYQKVLNMTLGIGSDKSPATRKAEEPLASPFRRGYTRPGRPGLPVTPIVVSTPGHPAHIGTPVAGTGSATKHGSASSTAASIFRSFRRRSLRRSFRRTKSFLVKNSTTTTTTPTVTGNAINRPVNKRVMRWWTDDQKENRKFNPTSCFFLFLWKIWLSVSFTSQWGGGHLVPSPLHRWPLIIWFGYENAPPSSMANVSVIIPRNQFWSFCYSALTEALGAFFYISRHDWRERERERGLLATVFGHYCQSGWVPGGS